MKNLKLTKVLLLLSSILMFESAQAGLCDTVCSSVASKKFFVSGVSGASSYSWTATGGITIVSGQGTDTVRLNFTGATGGIQTICVIPTNVCGSMTPACFSVFVQTNPGKPNAGADQSVCVGANLTFTATGSAGAVFTWTRPNATNFMGATLAMNPTVLADSGQYIVYQSVNGCISSLADTVIGVVNSNPGAAMGTTSTAAICETGTKALVGAPAGGTWSVVSGGGSVAGSTYTPTNVTSNTQVIVQYTVPANGSCASTTDNDTFQVDFQNIAMGTTPNTAICETGTKALVGAPAGGTWSVVSGGGSVAGSTYTPTNVTSNTQVVVQYTSAVNGMCASTTDNDTFQVDFQNIAMGTTPNTAICETGTKALVGAPAGGTWSVVSGGGSVAGSTYTPTNVTSNTQVVVQYTSAVNGMCASTTDNDTFQVDFQNIAMGTTPNTAICETGTKVLVGAPAGGTWSVVSGGGSVAGSTYTPTNVTSNTQVVVQYTSAVNGMCASTTDNDTFQVDFQNIAMGTTPNTAICETGTKALVGAPAGGTWSVVSGGGSVAGSTYTPTNVTSNTQVVVQYTSAVNGMCASTTDNDTFQVDFQNIAMGTTPNTAICETGTKALVGAPAGGTWSVVSGGGSVAGSTYTPTNVTSNTQVVVQYTSAANGMCASTTDNDTFQVDFQNIAMGTTPNTAICETGTKALVGAPAGGTWSVVSGGGSVAGSTYTPTNVTSNTQVVVQYTSAVNGMCASTTDNDTFQVDFQNIAMGTTPNTAICETGTKALVGAPAGGTWSVVSGGGSVAGSTYTPTNVTSNTQVVVQYTSAVNGMCASTTDNDTFQVDFQNIAMGTTPNTAICETGTKALVGAPAGGTWSVVSGGGSVAGSTYTPTNVTSNTQVVVQYTSAANGMCASTTDNDTFMIDSFSGTAVNTTATTNICEANTKTLVGAPIAGGSWSIVSGGGSILGTTYTPANVASNTNVTVRYTVAANGMCAATTADATFIVQPNPIISGFTTANPTTCLGTNGSITLDGLDPTTSFVVSYTGSPAPTNPYTSNGTGQLVIGSLPAGTYSNITVTLSGCSSNSVGPATLIGPLPAGTPVINCQ